MGARGRRRELNAARSGPKGLALMDCAMNKTAGRRLAVLALGVTVSVMTAADGWAQMPIAGMPTGTGNIAAGRGPRAMPDKPPEPPPDAVPGARARQPAAPMTRAAGDMQ